MPSTHAQSSTPSIAPASDRALLISFGETFSEECHLKVRALVHALKERKDLSLREIQPAYTSVLLTVDLLRTDLHALTAALKPILAKLEQQKDTPIALPLHRVEVPVCYEAPLAPDLADVAKHTGLSTAEVIHLHSATEYTVCFFGFMPGFAYWSGLPPQIAVPRLAAPRLKVPAGSVAIGGAQTGIYPLETPGGWRIIGRTPMTLFDSARRPPCVLELGDRVRIKAISFDEFKALGGIWAS